MDILVTGSTGLIGSALVEGLRTVGYGVRRLLRTGDGRRPGDGYWDPARGAIEASCLEGDVAAIVHLAGESLATGRWTEEKKRGILESRVRGTKVLAEIVGARGEPLPALICASAVGYYGDRGDEVLTESSPAGKGFLAEVCRQWEAAADPARAAGARVVHLRFGAVLSSKGGALAKMLPVFRAGGGGRIGRGKQYLSWISLEDAVRAILHVLSDRSLSGPINVTAPAPVTNAAFTRVLGGILHRPTLLAMPAFMVRLALGEMADELLLASVRAEPARLLASGFSFARPDLEATLRAELGS